MIRALVAGVAIALAASSGQAAVVLAFSEYEDAEAPVDLGGVGGNGLERGYLYGLSAYQAPGTWYFSDDGLLGPVDGVSGPLGVIRQDGRAFTAQRIDLVLARSRAVRVYDGPLPEGIAGEEYMNPEGAPMHVRPEPIGLMFEALRSGKVFDNLSFLPQPANGTGIRFENGFSGVDRVDVSVLLPFYDEVESTILDYQFSDYAAGSVLCDDWCSDVQLDNLVVSAVPLPPSLFLLGSLLGLGLAAGGLRRRRGQA